MVRRFLNVEEGIKPKKAEILRFLLETLKIG